MLFEGKRVFWFGERFVQSNIELAAKGYNDRYRVFIEVDYYGPFDISADTLLRYDSDTESYLSNHFTGQIPSKSVLYFTEYSKFPRTKLSVSDLKRCIKVEKANYIVLKELPKSEECNDLYHIFTCDSKPDFVYVIKDSVYQLLYSGNLDFMNFQLMETDGIVLSEIYCGKIKASTKYDFIENYNNGTYKVPFILDNELDSQINAMLPDPTLDEVLAIKDMLNSTDSSIIKLAIRMIAGFNISKFPLTFRLLLHECGNWTYSYNGGGSTVAKQIKESLNIEVYYTRRRPYYSLKEVCRNQKITYTKEDIDLAKQLAKNIQAVQDEPLRFEKEIWFPDEF